MAKSDLPLGEWLFNRQYLLAREIPAALRHWSLADLGGGWRCAYKNTSVEVVTSDSGSIAGIGELLDHRHPSSTNREVLEALLAAYEHADQDSADERVHSEMDHLGGRWIIFTNLRGQTRVYPDAISTKSTVYTTGERELLVATQPQLVAETLGLGRSELARRAEVEKPVHWKSTLTPYEGVRRLLPNSFLDLRRRTARRFWPPADPPPDVGLDMTAHLMADCLRGLAVAAATRWPLKIALTAGYDSRLTLAVTSDLPNVEYVTQDRTNKPAYEVEIAQRLAADLGLRHTVASPETLLHLGPTQLVMRRNGADMRSTNRSAVLHGQHVADGEMLVLSHCAHALRRDKLELDTPKKIRRQTRSRNRRLFGEDIDEPMEALREHLTDIPKKSWVSLAELWKLEGHEGVWLPNKYVVLDTFAPVMSLQNNRYFQSLGFALPERYRMPENRLLMRMFELLNPQLLDLPFNAPLTVGTDGRA